MANGWRYKKGNPEYDRYIHSAAWRDTANRRLDQDEHTCQVCGSDATDVHHLTYERFGHEDMHDLVSLCRKCHEKAEALYDPSVIPWAMDEVKPEGNNFMAAMRVDAMTIAPLVFDYLKEARGDTFDALMRLRQPIDAEGKRYWGVLKRAVDALCRKRYSRNCVEDRLDMMVGTITNRVTAICLHQIEHYIRNGIQASLHETVMTEYALRGKWKDVATHLCRRCDQQGELYCTTGGMINGDQSVGSDHTLRCARLAILHPVLPAAIFYTITACQAHGEASWRQLGDHGAQLHGGQHEQSVLLRLECLYGRGLRLQRCIPVIFL